MREGGIERREKPESINSFVIDATSIRKTIESSLVANLVREILDYNPSINYVPFECHRDFVYLFHRKRIDLYPPSS